MLSEALAMRVEELPARVMPKEHRVATKGDQAVEGLEEELQSENQI